MHYAGPPTRRHLNAPEGNRSAVSPHPARGRGCRVACHRALNNACARAGACMSVRRRLPVYEMHHASMSLLRIRCVLDHSTTVGEL